MSHSTALSVMVLALLLVTCGCSAGVGVQPTPTPTPTPMPTPTPEPPKRILSVGNSFATWGPDIMLLAVFSKPRWQIEVRNSNIGGASLEKHWTVGRASEEIAQGDYDVVLLQDAFQVTTATVFKQHVRLFVAQIREAGARPVLVMTWPDKPFWATVEEIAQAHREIATEVGADVAPVPIAWQRAMAERPDVELYHYDGRHANDRGGYLAACVVYATVFGKSPVGLPSEPLGVTGDDAAFLQRIAWEAVEAYRAQR